MSNNRGQSMFEVVIALFVITLIIVGVVSMSTNSISNSTFSKNKTQAGRYTQEAIEWLRSEKIADLTIFKAHVQTPKYCLNTLNTQVWLNTGSCLLTEVISGTSFRREVNFSSTSVSGNNIIIAEVVTIWTDSKGYHEAKSTTNFNEK